MLLDDLDPVERRSVESAAVLRRVTQPMLAAVLADADPPDVEQAWRALRGLPFTRSRRRAWRSSRSPARRSRAHWRSGTRRGSGSCAGGRPWPRCSDVERAPELGDHRRPALPRPEPGHPQQLPPARPTSSTRSRPPSSDDRAAVLAIAERHDGRRGRRSSRTGGGRTAPGFVVGRGPDGEVTAFSILVPLAEVDARLADAGRGARGVPRRRPAAPAARGRRRPRAPPGVGAAPRRATVPRARRDGRRHEAALPGAAPGVGPRLRRGGRLAGTGAGAAAAGLRPDRARDRDRRAARCSRAPSTSAPAASTAGCSGWCSPRRRRPPAAPEAAADRRCSPSSAPANGRC